MKKIKIISIILFTLLLIVSIGFNIETLSKQKQRREMIIGQLYDSIIDASRNLDSVIVAYEQDDVESAKANLRYASLAFRKIENIIVLQNTGVDEALFHPGTLSFEFIADILDDKIKSQRVNEITISSIISDNMISQNEILFVKKLAIDLNTVYKEMTISEPYKVNKDLSIKDVNAILNEFYLTWSTVENESPYRLLRSEK